MKALLKLPLAATRYPVTIGASRPETFLQGPGMRMRDPHRRRSQQIAGKRGVGRGAGIRERDRDRYQDDNRCQRLDEGNDQTSGGQEQAKRHEITAHPVPNRVDAQCPVAKPLMMMFTPVAMNNGTDV